MQRLKNIRTALAMIILLTILLMISLPYGKIYFITMFIVLLFEIIFILCLDIKIQKEEWKDYEPE